MKHGKLKAVLVIIIGLLLGYVVATQLGGFLGIEFIAKDLPAEVTPDAVAPPLAQASKETPLNPVAAIVLPAGALQDDLYIRAADVLADAVATRTGQRPQVVEAGSGRPPVGASSSARKRCRNLPAHDTRWARCSYSRLSQRPTDSGRWLLSAAAAWAMLTACIA